MGSVVGTAANGIGTLLGNAFAAPFRALFRVSCEGVCSGTWEVACFLEHLCVASLARLFMVLVLLYIMLFFVYLICKVGIIKCVAKNSCKMTAAACWAAPRASSGASCATRSACTAVDAADNLRTSKQADGDGALTRRTPPIVIATVWQGVRAVRQSGAEEEEEGPSSVRERRKDRLRQSLRLKRLGSKKEQYATVRTHGSGRHHQHGRVALGRAEVPSTSMRVHGSPRRR